MFVVKALFSVLIAFMCFPLLLKLDLILVAFSKNPLLSYQSSSFLVCEFYNLLCLLTFYPYFLAFHPFELKSQFIYFPFVLLNSKST